MTCILILSMHATCPVSPALLLLFKKIFSDAIFSALPALGLTAVQISRSTPFCQTVSTCELLSRERTVTDMRNI
jgi:hypothetical protein